MTRFIIQSTAEWLWHGIYFSTQWCKLLTNPSRFNRKIRKVMP